jgi:hypothetical protein
MEQMLQIITHIGTRGTLFTPSAPQLLRRSQFINKGNRQKRSNKTQMEHLRLKSDPRSPNRLKKKNPPISGRVSMS